MPTRRKATIKLYDGDDLAELQRLRVAVHDALEAEDDTTPSLADTSAEEARIAFNDFLHGEADERATVVELQALRWDVWEEMEAAHPPREIDKTEDVTELVDVEGEDEPVEKTRTVTTKVPHPEDDGIEVNLKTLPRVLVPASVIGPAGFEPAELSKPDYMRLFYAALALNRQAADPKEIAPFASDLESTDE